MLRTLVAALVAALALGLPSGSLAQDAPGEPPAPTAARPKPAPKPKAGSERKARSEPKPEPAPAKLDALQARLLKAASHAPTRRKAA